MNCKDHGQKTRFCHTCCIETDNFQAVLINQILDRMDAIWEASPEDMKEKIRSIERQYPSNIRIIKNFPFGCELDDFFAGDGDTVLEYLSEVITEPKPKGSKLGISRSGFFHYVTE